MLVWYDVQVNENGMPPVPGCVVRPTNHSRRVPSTDAIQTIDRPYSHVLSRCASATKPSQKLYKYEYLVTSVRLVRRHHMHNRILHEKRTVEQVLPTDIHRGCLASPFAFDKIPGRQLTSMYNCTTVVLLVLLLLCCTSMDSSCHLLQYGTYSAVVLCSCLWL